MSCYHLLVERMRDLDLILIERSTKSGQWIESSFNGKLKLTCFFIEGCKSLKLFMSDL